MDFDDDGAAVQDQIELSSLFSPECVLTVPYGADKEATLSCLVESLTRAGKLPAAKVAGIIAALLERERFGTTGLGKGLALPHMRTRDMDEFAGAIGVAPAGVDFNSLDGLPTRLIILVLSPFERRRQHGEIMGRLATLLSDQTLQYSVRIPRTADSLFRFLGF